jgi:hypothetical protein
LTTQALISMNTHGVSIRTELARQSEWLFSISGKLST